MPLPNGPPPPVGISEYWKVPLPISLSVSLDPESVETFWSLHKLYRPNKNYSLGPSMAGGPGIGGSAAGGGSGSSAAGGGSSISAAGGEIVAVGGGSGSLARGAGSGGSAGGARSGEVGPLGKGEMFGINWTEPSVDAPWGKIGEFRIGFDIPIVTEEMKSDSDDEEEPPTMELDELAGVVYITDVEPYSNGCDGLLVA